MSPATEGLARSVHTRLVNHAHDIQVDPNLVLTRYAIERYLYRLSCSSHVDRFVLKGALLLLAWLGETLRPTKDADFLGLGDLSDDALANIFAEVCTVAVEPDGMAYDPRSVRIAAIREGDDYGGKRITLRAELGSARLPVQIDVGFGDAVDPPAEWLDYPGLLDLPTPRLRAYPPEVVVAEKLHAMLERGSRNSRMRDFFDVSTLATERPFAGERLVRAIRSTFERRRTPFPETAPLALTEDFAKVEGKSAQWAAFVRRSGIEPPHGGLGYAVSGVAAFLLEPLSAARKGERFEKRWPAGGPWNS